MDREDAKMNEPVFFVVWKYQVVVSNYLQHFKIPKRASFLVVEVQGEDPQMWFLVNPKNEKELRSFRVVDTGNPTIRAIRDKYLGTFQQPPYVWHLFEVLDDEEEIRRQLQGDR
jgi:hypothetical protein